MNFKKVLVVFSFLIFFGFFIYLNYSTSNFKKSSEIQNVRFGPIEVYGDENKAGALILYFYSDSEISSEKSTDQDKLIISLVERGEVVAAVDLDKYSANLKNDNGVECYEAAGEIARLSQVLQNSLKMDGISKSIIIGKGRKASGFSFLVHRFLDEDIWGSFSTDLSWNGLNDNICSETKLTEVNGQNFKTYFESEKAEYKNWKFYSSINESIGVENEVNLDFFQCDNKTCPVIDSFLPKTEASQIASLPIIEIFPKIKKVDYFVLFLSGDGGWATIDKEIGGYLAQQGIPVVGFNSLKYFWKEKDPVKMSDDISKIIEEYQIKFKTKKFMLVGFSFGANMIPFILNRIPKIILDNLSSYALLSPSLKTKFEIHFTDWLPGGESDDGLSILDEMQKVQDIKAVCINGRQEEESLCNQLLPSSIKSIHVEGDHHFDDDYIGISKILISEFDSSLESQNVR